MRDDFENFLSALELEGRSSSVPSYRSGLLNFEQWLDLVGLADHRAISLDDLQAFQRWLAEVYKTPNRKPLAKTTQATRLSSVKALYFWLHRRRMIPVNPAAKLKLPKPPRRRPARDHLTQQEVIGCVQTQAKVVESMKKGTVEWAKQFCDLALLCLAFATGRRTSGLRNLRVSDIDFKRRETRIAWEKGKPGRVMPACGWALDVVKNYMEQARPVLLNGRPDRGWLFVAKESDRISGELLGRMLRRVQRLTVEENPDLDELEAKKLTSHSTRVTFAKTMMFQNGCGVRIVKELLMHERLSTTANTYLPMETDDLRRRLRLFHPRA